MAMTRWVLAVAVTMCAVLAIGCGSNLNQQNAPYNTQSSFGRGAGPSTAAPGGAGRLPSQSPAGATSVTHPIDLILRVAVNEAVGEASRFAGDWDGFVQWAADRGFTAISIYAVDVAAQGSTPAAFHFPDLSFFDGSKLSDRFSQGNHNIGALAVAAHNRNLRVEADLTAVALGTQTSSSEPRLTAEHIGDLCRHLIADVHVDNVTARGFTPEWVEAAATACRSAGGSFIDGGADLLSAPKIAEAVAGVSRIGRDSLSLASSELAFTSGREGSLPVWAGVTYGRAQDPTDPLYSAWQSVKYVESAILYLALLARPDGLVLDLPISALDTVSSNALTQAKQYAARADDRPACNVLAVGQVDAGDVAAAVNGITSAGFDAVFTAAPLADARAFYVIAAPDGSGNPPIGGQDLPDDVVRVFSSGKVAVLQVCGTFPAVGAHAGWDAARRALGLDTTDYPTQQKPIAQGRYHDLGFPFGVASGLAGRPWGSVITTHHLVTAKAECTGTDEFQDVVLVASQSYGREGKNILVNGAALDLSASFPISNLLANGGGLQAPTTALCVAGSTSGFFAAQGDATVKIKLGGPDAGVTERRLSGGEIAIIEPAAG